MVEATQITDRQIWLRTYSANENWNGDLDLARVTLTASEAARLAGLCEELDAFDKAHGGMAEKFVFVDYEPEWFSVTHISEGEELLESLEDVDPYAVMTDEFPAVNQPEKPRTEFDRLHVLKDEVYWSCEPKNSDVLITTAALPVKLLREIAGI